MPPCYRRGKTEAQRRVQAPVTADPRLRSLSTALRHLYLIDLLLLRLSFIALICTAENSEANLISRGSHIHDNSQLQLIKDKN